MKLKITHVHTHGASSFTYDEIPNTEWLVGYLKQAKTYTKHAHVKKVKVKIYSSDGSLQLKLSFS